MKNPLHNNQFDSSEQFDDEEIYRLLREENKYMTPPPQVRQNLINSVRMINKSAGLSTASGTLSGIIKKVGIPIAAGIAMYFSVLYMNNDADNAANIPNPQHSNATAQSVQIPSNKAIPIVSSIENHSANNNSTINISSKTASTNSAINSNITDLSSSTIDDKPELIDNRITNIQNASSNLIDGINYSYINSEYYSPNKPQTDGISLSNLLNTNSIDYKSSDRYVISVRGMAGTTFADNYNASSSIPNSLALGIYKSISGSDNLSIGLEFGREPYQKKFFNKYEPNQLEYVDNPNTIWGAVGVKYRIAEWNIAGLALTPFTGLLLGAGEIGPMGRLNIGIDQQITNRISVTIGAEFSTMLYNNKVQWYSSNKFGITAGINYQL